MKLCYIRPLKLNQMRVQLDVHITVISEEVNLDAALEAVNALEEASLPDPSAYNGPSTSKGVKRPAPAVDVNGNEADSDDDVIEPGKDMSLVRKAAKAASPTESNFSSSSYSSPKSSNVDWEETQRREEFNRRVVDEMEDHKKKMKSNDDLISHIKGQKKSLRAHREAIREQLRLLDVQELSLDKREKVPQVKRKKYMISSLQNRKSAHSKLLTCFVDRQSMIFNK
ncbi:hypothetical protein NQ315_000478 [Exocentrus adspersus]|uniref:Uncharacterized protein n=1 Tax=Exocentrus adspersus TaxID=1586481 RepID=A0AAV8VEH7_9CUCU|nr:hypothetical protein NQ315_000478 [Exocentrus adspersus]